MTEKTSNEIKELVGKTLTKVDKSEDEIVFTTNAGEVYKLHHWQDCCESVSIEDVCGDLSDLIGSPLVEAEEVTSDKDPEGITKEHQKDSFTWTFYKLRTAKGTVTIRWYGESNGFYSERVEFVHVL